MTTHRRRLLISIILIGVIFITPFFALAQSSSYSAETISLQDLLTFLRNEKQLFIAYDPQGVQNVMSDYSCLQAENIVDCLIETHQRDFEFVMIDESNIMMRRRTTPSSRKVRGRVLDGVNGQPLAFAHVITLPDSAVNISDEEGYFSLHAGDKDEAIQVIVQYLGYESLRQSIIFEDEIYEISLQSESLEMEIANVIAPLPIIVQQGDKQSIRISGSQAGKLPGPTGGDVMRGVQIIAGVSATNDFSSELKIRGSDGDQSLVLLDNIPLYKTGHYYNIFSIVNDEPIKDLALYKNYLPVDQGDVTSGILKMNLNNPLEEKAQISADVNILTSDIYASTPITKSLGIMISGRTTNANVSQGAFSELFSNHSSLNQFEVNDESEVFQTSIQPKMTFNDLIASATLQAATRCQISGTYFYASDDVLLSNAYTIESRNDERAVNYQFESAQSWRNRGIGAAIEMFWNQNHVTSFKVYNSSFKREDGTRTSLMRIPDRTEDELDRIFFLMNDEIEDFSMSFNTQHTLTGKNVFNWGYQMQRLDVSSSIERGREVRAARDQEATIHSLFSSFELKSTSRLNLIAGIRASFNSLENKMFYSPRIQGQFEIEEGLILKSSLGYYNQYLRTITILNGNNTNKEIWALAYQADIPKLSSTLGMVGLNWINSVLSIDLEIYSRHEQGVMQELIEGNGLSPSSTLTSLDPELFIGEGRRYGFDLMLKKDIKSYQTVMSYTLSKGEVSFDEFQNGNWIPSPEDRRHEIKWYNTISIGKFDLQLNPVFASGTVRYNPQIAIPNNDRIGYQPLDNYFRTDIGAIYNFTIGKHNAKLGFSIFNLSDHQNTTSIRYARLDEFQQQSRTTFFAEQIELLDRTANIRFQITLK